ncbi:MAG: UvrD-helicase domain-containing protein [Rhodospirillales bacterium]|nr:UvrD-helicase domain-containing protein [Rhodospirillales bacterium]
MDKRVVLAVAGSGKTRLLIDQLNEHDRFLILTYTNNNQENLKARIFEKFSCIPQNIKISGYFQFLYGFCVKPLLGDELDIKGICWKVPPAYTLKLKRDKRAFYFDDYDFIYHNRMAKLIEGMSEIKERIAKYYDHLLIDEAQDFGGHDFNFLCSLAKMDPDILLVGDFYQHTFDTSKDGATNSTLYNDYDKYLAKLEKSGFKADKTTLVKSHRCSPTVCTYVHKNLEIHIESHRQDETEIIVCDSQEDADRLFKDQSIVKLFYQNSSKYPCYSDNWGNSKGQDHYNDVCIVLNPSSLKNFQEGTMAELNPQTKGKLYVACTRARGDLYFVPEKYFKKFKMNA